MTSLPGVVIVIDSTFEDIAINEAKRMNIPIVAVVDTIRSIRLFISKFGEAVVEGRNRKIQESANAQQLAAEKAAAEASAAAEGDTAGDALVTEKEN
jgi:small subunit ribosomal protein S2